MFETLAEEDAMDYCVSLCQITVQRDRAEGHINWWAEKKLTTFLTHSGFTDVRKSRRNQSLYPEMRNPDLFDTSGPNKSLYIEAIK